MEPNPASPWRARDFLDLRGAESRIAKEREECDRLVAQINALKDESERAEQAFGGASLSRGASLASSTAPPPRPAPPPPVPPSPAAFVRGRSEASTTRSVATSASRPRGASQQPSAAAPGGGRRSVSASRSSVVSATRGHAAPSLVTYRSSIYRSVSPTKRAVTVGPNSNVVISSFSRASRFRDDKADVPGPGQYAPHSTDFAPVAIERGEASQEGRQGHTYDAYNAATGLRPTQAQAHASAMAFATARVRGGASGTIGATGSFSGSGAGSPGSASQAAGSGGGGGGWGGSASNAGSPGSASQSQGPSALSLGRGLGAGAGAGTGAGSTLISDDMGGVGGIKAHAQAVLDGFNGDARAALESLVKRERGSRREQVALRQATNVSRLETANRLSQMASELEAARARLAKRDSAVDASRNRLRMIGDVLARAEAAHLSLQRALFDAAAQAAAAAAAAAAAQAEAASGYGMGSLAPRHGGGASGGGGSVERALIARAQEAAHAIEAALASARAIVSGPGDRDGDSASVGPGPGPSFNGAAGGAGGGFLGYSSMSAALDSGDRLRRLGDLGPSDALVTRENSKLALVQEHAALAPQQPARDRHLTGAQARGIAPGVDLAVTRGISAEQVAAFARRVAETQAAAEGQQQLNQHIQAQAQGAAAAVVAAPAAPASHSARHSAAAAAPRPAPAAASSSAVYDSGAAMAALMESFANSFLQPNVLSFFKAHKAALVGIFATYAGTEGQPLAAEGRMPRAALERFARDYRLCPALMASDELTQLAQEVTRAVGHDGGTDELSYAQFVELLGLVAYVLAAGSGGGAASATMLHKLHLLLLALETSGANFKGEAAAKMLRVASESVRTLVSTQQAFAAQQRSQSLSR